jgi:very-short-patch-repair endonuclease
LLEQTAKQATKKPNKLEIKGYSLLERLGVKFLSQYIIGGKFCVDAFIPAAKTVVQFDGDYWHGNPAVFPVPDERQKHRQKLDKSQDKYMAACGYSVIRIWEQDFRKNLIEVIARLRPFSTLPEHTAVPLESYPGEAEATPPFEPPVLHSEA